MLSWVYWLVLAVVVCFSAVLFFGAPYLPTLKGQTKAAFGLLDLKPGQRLLELGSGDGRVLVAAARAGYVAVGIELNPILFVYSWLRLLPYGKRATVKWGNFWNMKWPPADAVFVFLLNPYMKQLDKRMQKYKKPLASVAFEIPGKKHSAERSGVFLYKY